MADAVIKRCACRAAYTKAQWSALHCVGQSADGGEPYEMRVCASCGSTIAIGTRAKPEARHAAKKKR